METVGNTASPLKLVAAPSKSQQIASFLKQQIRSGELTPGDKLSSLRTLAHHFGVSSKAVFSACEQLESQGLVVREAGRGVFVSAQAEPEPASFALLTSFRESEIERYYDELYADARLHHALCTPILFGDDMPWQSMLRAVNRQQPRAIFVDLGRSTQLEAIRDAAGETPLCFVHRWQWDRPAAGPAVLVDFSAMYAEAFTWLLARGHRRIAFVGPHAEPRAEYGKFAAEGAAAAGLDFGSHALPYIGREAFQHAPHRVADLFNTPDRPTALVSVNDHNAALFRDQLERAFPDCAGIDVVGAYDTLWSRQPGREFHSFRIDYASLWEQAFDLMEAPESKDIHWLQPELIVRDAEPEKG